MTLVGASPGGAWPTTPVLALARWQDHGFYLSVRIRPRALVIGYLAPGWLEFHSDPGAPTLPADVEVDEERVHLKGAGLIQRFGAVDGDSFLLCGNGPTASMHLRMVAADCVEQALRDPTVRPSRPLMADGWERWRPGWEGETPDATDPD